LLHDLAQSWWIVFLCCEERGDNVRRRRRMMTVKYRLRPPRWKKDVARPLNVGQQVQARLDISLGMAATQRMIQEREAIDHPRLVAPILDIR
jgi:hypothetical protein